MSDDRYESHAAGFVARVQHGPTRAGRFWLCWSAALALLVGVVVIVVRAG